MRDHLPPRPWINECGIINLDNFSGPGTHWVAYCKKGNESEYFDSFGNLQPPREVVRYLDSNLMYNYEAYQDFDAVNCGHLCLDFLYNCYLEMYK